MRTIPPAGVLARLSFKALVRSIQMTRCGTAACVSNALVDLRRKCSRRL